MSKRDLILFSRSHLTGLVEPLIETLEIQRIYNINLSEKGKGIIRLFYDIFKDSDGKRTYVFLDYRPIIILVLLKYIKKRGHTVIFIQHGYFETSGFRNLNRRGIKWYLNSFYFMCFYLILGTGGNCSLLKRIHISVIALFKGASKVSNLLSQNLELDHAFIYDDPSRRIFMKEFSGLVNILSITGSLDEETFKYHASGKSIYVSQPLHKTGHVSEEGYRAYLDNLFKSNVDLLFLLHPKIEKEWIEKIIEPQRIITKKDVLDKLKVKLVVGHFSSILLGIDERIELKIDNLIGSENLTECALFNARTKITFNGLTNIKSKLNNTCPRNNSKTNGIPPTT